MTYQYLSAVAALAAFRDGSISPLELFDAVHAVAERAEPSLNAFTFTDYESAREQAVQATKAYARDPDGVRPLEGLLIAVKELTPVKGQPFTMGSRAMAGNVATETEPAIVRAIDAGAIIHARTNSPEFGCLSVTDSPLFGQTCNPWNPALSPAGSSGGAAAALAAGMTTLAQGTDSAGSLRLPAAACGVVGFKSAHGRVPQLPPMNLEPCNHVGPMTRTVADCELLFSIMAGPHPADLHSYLPEASSPTAGLKPGVRVGTFDIGGLDLDHDVAQAMAESIQVIRDHGGEVRQFDLGWTYDRIFTATKLIYAAAYAPRVNDIATEHPDLMSDYVLDFVQQVLPLSQRSDFLLRGREIVGELQRPLARAFQEVDFFVLPTMALPAPELNDHYLDHGPVVNGIEQPDKWICGHTMAFNLMSHCPVLSVPNGVARNGVPTGMQIVGRPYQDYDVLGFGRDFEAARSLGLYADRFPVIR